VRIFTRYILSEVLSHALIGGALFTFVLFMPNLGPILELVVRNSASPSNIVEIFLYTLPNTFTVTIPMAVLVGILLGLSRLAADSEITAMRASGVGVWRFIRIVSVVAILGWGLGLANSLLLAPRASRALLELQNSLKNSQASFEVQPRVFYEDFKNYVLYVQDVRPANGAANWHRIFLADLSDPAAPKVTTAESATVVNGDEGTIRMRMRDGSEHESNNNDASQYNISTFTTTDLPLLAGTQTDPHIARRDISIYAMSNHELLEKARLPGGKWYMIEMHKRFAYPAACLVMMLVGVPLGISSRRGGKSAGFVVTIILVFVYYFLSSTGIALGRQGKMPAFAGVWMANVLFAMCGVFLLHQMATGGSILSAAGSIGTSFRDWFPFKKRSSQPATTPAPRERHSRFPLILDEYVLREFLTTFGLVLVSFVLLMLVFTFFELLGDIIRNRTPLVTVGDYLVNLTPSMIYTIVPLSVLIAVLVTFGVLNRTSELTAMKATGISLYRVVLPVLVVALMLAGTLFVFDDFYLPAANRRQEALRSIIKGKPAQTFLRPDRKWIFGLQEPGEPGRIFYYQFFDRDREKFANISVFEFNQDTFSISRRIYASSAHWAPELHKWIFESGWVRTFGGEAQTSFNAFDVKTFPELREEPIYFNKESRQSSEMNFAELQRYIQDLSQSGFDTMRLRVQLNRKLAYPLITLVMAILAVPFSLSMGKRGSLTGVAVAIGVAIAYWVIAAAFEAMGEINILPAMMAAWSPDLLFALAGGYLLLRAPT
jgi:LPS export ABC transporter permease LptG/LPS export ABC transporter permease LptF